MASALLAATVLALIAVAAGGGGREKLLIGSHPDTHRLDSIELSYEENASGHVLYETSYKVETRGTVVRFSCTNCAVHEVSFRASEQDLRDLSSAFLNRSFFATPRVPKENAPTHATWHSLSYRDDQRVHEVNWFRDPPTTEIGQLRNRLLAIARMEYLTRTPAYEVLRQLKDDGGWWPSPESLAYLAFSHDVLSVKFLLDLNVEVTDDVLVHAAQGGDVETARMILERVDPRRQPSAVGRMLVVAAEWPWDERDTSLVKWLLTRPGADQYRADALRAAIQMHHDSISLALRQ